MISASDLVIPVYLNQQIVFDLVAVLRGGIASVTQISQTDKTAKDESRQIESSFGVGAAFSSLLKIDLSGKRDHTSSDKSTTTQTEDRIHTPVSLFITLRSILHEKKYLKDITSDATLATKVSPGDLVEFSTALKRNPLLETLESFIEMMDMFQTFIDTPKGKGKQKNEMTEMKKQMTSLVKSLQAGGTADLTTPPLESGHRAVISLETQNLNDPTMSDLVDGTFRVVGKVTRSISATDEAISLNRKSAINRLPPAVMQQFKTAFQAPDLASMSLPELEWEIPGPAIQVLPIAIFA
ncbi:hypothetical protein Mal35_33260 [Gimesia maris]|uniref:DUF6414 family protein n=1 Tax=Gimesia maris TaxID=122 RepID=UPI00118C390D|nr:hypothetical protein [Gimesia maris]QDT79857.1 hypothetical protein Mal35_33260 [Gimesia maris]